MKRSVFLRSLCMMLTVAMTLCCFAGCQSSAPVSGNDNGDKLEKLRDGLEKFQFNGMTIYLSDDFEDAGHGEYIGDDLTVQVDTVRISSLEDGAQIENEKDLRDYMLETYDEGYGEELESHKKNGVYYLLARDGDKGMALGLYLNGETVGAIMVMSEDFEKFEDEMILYATLGELKDHYKDHDMEDVYDDEDLHPVESTTAADPTEPEAPVQSVSLKIWTGTEDQKADDNWLQRQLEAFEAAHPEYLITWELGICSDGDIGTAVSNDPIAAADVYLFASEQIGTLVSSEAITELGGIYLYQVLNDNTQAMVGTVTFAEGEVYGFPMSGNCWYMFYNKDVFTEEDVKSLDAMLYKGTVGFEMENGWCNSAFFFANGCTMDASHGIDFGGQKGYDAAAAMISYANHPNFVNISSGMSDVSSLKDGTVDAIFGGYWSYEELHDALGDRLGVCQPPMVTIAGEQKQMKAFLSSKAIGVNPNCEDQDIAMQLAAFLSSPEAQLDRYRTHGAIPAHIELANDPTVMADPCALAELNTIANASVVYPAIPQMTTYWANAFSFGSFIVNGWITMDNYREQVDVYVQQLSSTI